MAIDRATRWVYIAIHPNKSAASARAFLKALAKACPIKITKLLTDNGKEFTDRLFGARGRKPSGEHEFDQLCQALGIEHRLTKPRTPQTNGMVERFNGRIAEVLATRRYDSAQDLETTLLRYVWIYNHHLPQKALGHRCPMDAMRQWYAEKPQLFTKIPRNRPGPNTFMVATSYCGSWAASAGVAASMVCPCRPWHFTQPLLSRSPVATSPATFLACALTGWAA